MTDYLVYDVFTDRPFGGNPLAIVPNATDLPEDKLQDIAREFNYSETVFLYPPDRGGVAKLRIFTPTMEVPFAGHPTIGTAVMLGEAGLGPEFVVELGIGDLDIWSSGGRASFTTTRACDILDHPEPALVARALGTPETTLARPPVMASLGLGFTFTELTDRAALSDLVPDVAAFRKGAALYPQGLDFAQCAYVRQGARIDMRVFAPLDNIPEDPATGSAAATLAALLAEGGLLELTVHQGHDMGRPSCIEVSARGPAVTVTGNAIRVMEGKLVV